MTDLTTTPPDICPDCGSAIHAPWCAEFKRRDARRKRREARKLRDEAMARIDQSAGAVWKRQAYEFLASYVERLAPGERFTATHARLASAQTVPTPHDDRAWGPIVRMALDKGLIVESGYLPNIEPRAHCRPTRAFQRKVPS